MDYLRRLSLFRDVYHVISLVILLVFAFAAPVWVTVLLLFIMQAFEGKAAY